MDERRSFDVWPPRSRSFGRNVPTMVGPTTPNRRGNSHGSFSQREGHGHRAACRHAARGPQSDVPVAGAADDHGRLGRRCDDGSVADIGICSGRGRRHSPERISRRSVQHTQAVHGRAVDVRPRLPRRGCRPGVSRAAARARDAGVRNRRGHADGLHAHHPALPARAPRFGHGHRRPGHQLRSCRRPLDLGHSHRFGRLACALRDRGRARHRRRHRRRVLPRKPERLRTRIVRRSFRHPARLRHGGGCSTGFPRSPRATLSCPPCS